VWARGEGVSHGVAGKGNTWGKGTMDQKDEYASRTSKQENLRSNNWRWKVGNAGPRSAVKGKTEFRGKREHHRLLIQALLKKKRKKKSRSKIGKWKGRGGKVK